MDIKTIANGNSYLTSIRIILKKYTNSTNLGCFQHIYNNSQQVDCFKSYILTSLLCVNFCSLRGETSSFLFFN